MRKYAAYFSTSIMLFVFLSILLHASSERPHPPHAGTLLLADMAPALLVKLLPGDTASVPLGINDVDIDIQVTGNIAVTTMTLNFYNDQNRNLEGQFIFPLTEGQTIHSFAMDVNGTMREGAVVEKQKGREVFEKIERRRVDPGLLEWSKGNNFSARVFPIPSKGYKKIVVAFQQELESSGDAFTYYLPLAFKTPVKHFGIKAAVNGDANQPIPMQENTYILNFAKPADKWQAQADYKNIIPDHTVEFQIPQSNKTAPVYIEKIPGTDSYYFYALVRADVKSEAKQDPQKLGIIWDVSGSAAARDREKEIDIIKQYLAKLKNVQVQVQTFSVAISAKKDFDVSGGNSNGLIDYLRSFEPDGGTQLGLDLSASDRDEILFFSDGMHNFGERDMRFPKCPIYTFGTGNGADYSTLQYISRSTNGSYINATVLKTEDVIAQLTQTGFNFISSRAQGPISQVYPSIATPCNGYFGIAGIVEGKSGSLKLNFGSGNTVSQSIEINIANAQMAEKTIGRIWAQKKIAELSLQSEQNEQQIAGLGKQFSVITPYTSLIVLEGLDDYLQYRITPPDEKTKKEYDEKIKQLSQENIKTDKTHADQVAEDFRKVVAWWNTDYKPVYHRDTVYVDSIQHGRVFQGGSWGDLRDEDTIDRVYLVDPIHRSRLASGNVSQSASYYSINPTTLEEESSPPVAAGDATPMPAARRNYRRGDVRNYESSDNNADRAARPTVRFLEMSAKKDEEVEAEDISSDKMEPMKGTMNLKAWDSKEPYMVDLKAASGDALYRKYLDLKKKYKDMPSFYIDVADYFEKANRREDAIRILSNLAEIRPDDSRLMRVMAHRLQQWKENKLATNVFAEVLKMRPEEPQSYRDLGLSYAESKDYQKAVDMLCKVVNGKWDDRFPEIEALTACEINYLLAGAGAKPNLDSLDKRLIKDMPVDVRVVIDWDADNCDIDLWLTDPRGEKCYYSHPLTAAGGRISRDFTGGYGPEEFKLKKALAGKYKIEINYFSNSQLTLAGPTTIHAQMYTNYGKANEQRKEIALRLTTQKDVVYVGDFEFTK